MMNKKDISINTKARNICLKGSKNTQTKMFSNRTSIKKAVDGTDYCISLKSHYRSLVNSKIPTYFCFAIYVIICLLGNVITGLIWLKHYQDIDIMPQNTTNNTHHNESLFSLFFNETTEYGESSLEDLKYVKETKEDEVSSILDFLTNASTHIEQVSSYL